MKHIKVAKYHSMTDDGQPFFVVETARRDPASVVLSKREWELMGRPERLYLTIEPLRSGEVAP